MLTSTKQSAQNIRLFIPGERSNFKQFQGVSFRAFSGITTSARKDESLRQEGAVGWSKLRRGTQLQTIERTSATRILF
jgi:hypothetical protein